MSFETLMIPVWLFMGMCIGLWTHVMLDFVRHLMSNPDLIKTKVYRS